MEITESQCAGVCVRVCTLTHIERSHASLWSSRVHGGHAGGHEVSDLLQGQQAGRVLPLLHLIVDQGLQLLTESLRRQPQKSFTKTTAQVYEILSVS